jgi:hypothetical protein
MPSRINYTKALINLIAGCIFDGLTDEETALLAGISSKTITRIRQGDECPSIKVATLERKRHYIRLIRDSNEGGNHWQRIAWFLERRYPKEFAKPEVQLQITDASTTNNTIVITAEQAQGLRSRSSAIESELATLTPPNKRNSQVNDKLLDVSEGDLRLAKASKKEQELKPELDKPSKSSPSTINPPAPAHPPTRTPADSQSPKTPALPQKSQLSGDSSNSSLPKSPKVIKRGSKNGGLASPGCAPKRRNYNVKGKSVKQIRT